MGKTLTIVGIALGIWTLPVSAEEQTAQSAQDVLIDLERGWNDAVYRQDADFVDNLLAEGERNKEEQRVIVAAALAKAGTQGKNELALQRIRIDFADVALEKKLKDEEAGK